VTIDAERFMRLRLRLELLWEELRVPHRDRDALAPTMAAPSAAGAAVVAAHVQALLAHRRATLSVLRAVRRREAAGAALRAALHPADGAADADALCGRLSAAAAATAACERAIRSWRKTLWRPLPFFWRGTNYAEKMLFDLASVAGDGAHGPRCAEAGATAVELAVLAPMADASGTFVKTMRAAVADAERTGSSAPLSRVDCRLLEAAAMLRKEPALQSKRELERATLARDGGFIPTIRVRPPPPDAHEPMAPHASPAKFFASTEPAAPPPVAIWDVYDFAPVAARADAAAAASPGKAAPPPSVKVSRASPLAAAVRAGPTPAKGIRLSAAAFQSPAYAIDAEADGSPPGAADAAAVSAKPAPLQRGASAAFGLTAGNDDDAAAAATAPPSPPRAPPATSPRRSPVTSPTKPPQRKAEAAVHSLKMAQLKKVDAEVDDLLDMLTTAEYSIDTDRSGGGRRCGGDGDGDGDDALAEGAGQAAEALMRTVEDALATPLPHGVLDLGDRRSSPAKAPASGSAQKRQHRRKKKRRRKKDASGEWEPQLSPAGEDEGSDSGDDAGEGDDGAALEYSDDFAEDSAAAAASEGVVPPGASALDMVIDAGTGDDETEAAPAPAPAANKPRSRGWGSLLSKSPAAATPQSGGAESGKARGGLRGLFSLRARKGV